MVFSKRYHFVITVVLLFTGRGIHADALKTLSYQSQAFDLKSNSARYVEEYREISQGGQLTEAQALYRVSSGKIVARKRLFFQGELWKPSLRFEDERDGYTKGIEFEGDTMRIFFRKTRGEPFQEKRLKVPAPVVVDAGIHYFIRNNWRQLMRGEPLGFNFVVPRRLDFYKLRIEKTGEEKKGGRGWVRFEIKPDNFWLSLGSGVTGWGLTRFKYDAQTRQLVEYEGVSLIHDEKGQSYPVKSIYRHSP